MTLAVLARRATRPLRLVLFRLVLVVAPRMEWALFHLGNAYAEVGQRGQALPLWLRATDRPDARPAALQNLAATLLDLGRAADAVSPLQRLADGESPPSAERYAQLGQVVEKAGLGAPTIAAYERSLELDGGQDALRVRLAVLLERDGQGARALEHYRQLRDPRLAEKVAPRVRALRAKLGEQVAG